MVTPAPYCCRVPDVMITSHYVFCSRDVVLRHLVQITHIYGLLLWLAIHVIVVRHRHTLWLAPLNRLNRRWGRRRLIDIHGIYSRFVVSVVSEAVVG